MIMNEIDEEYSEIKDDYEDFLKEVERTVSKKLKINNVPIAFDIYGRIKSLSSIKEKLSSKRVIIERSICEFNDIVGLRIVLLFPEFKDRVVDLLCEEFKLLNNPNETEQNLDRFGYSSIHLILGIKDEWLHVLDWKNHATKKIEIQIRTVSEHIWAEISHALFYKREENIPKIITRDIYRLSAILEVVDEKLQNIKIQVESHFEHIRKCSYEEILGMDLNSETFRRVMSQNSSGIYNYDDTQNRELSSRIEHDYNILNVNILDALISGKIYTQDIDSSRYVEKVIDILEQEKRRIDQQEKT